MEDLGIVPVPTPPLLVVELLEPVILIQLIVLERPHQREWAPRLSLKKGRFLLLSFSPHCFNNTATASSVDLFLVRNQHQSQIPSVTKVDGQERTFLETEDYEKELFQESYELQT